MRATLSAFAAGLVFGLGLIVARMVDPAKVLGFLDLAGAWDPSLAFVMGGAVAVAAVGFRLAARRSNPLAASQFQLPAGRGIDSRLMVGSALFGVGWGLVGICPGPGIVALAFGNGKAAVFMAAMVAGMALWRWLPQVRMPARATMPPVES
jgi:uncharacterized protein